MDKREEFLMSAKLAGCPADQVKNLLLARIYLQDRQLAASAAARLCDVGDGPTAIGFGGAMGGGKTHWMYAQVGADDCQRQAGIKCLLLRKVGKSNAEQFDDMRQKLYSKLPHEYSAYRGLLTFKNGSKIIVGHFQNESDVDAYLGLEYDLIAIEEATTLTEGKFTMVETRCRTSKANWRPRMYLNCNPGGVGHGWFKRKMIEPYVKKSEKETRFIPANVSDNTYNNPEYRKILERLSGWQKRAWLNGDWDLAAGQFFNTFSRDVHVIDDFDLGRAKSWKASFDYGYTHFTEFLLGAYDSDGNLFIVDEHAARKWLPERHAAAIKAMITRHGVQDQLAGIVAGSDVFSRQSDGSTIAQEYHRHGVTLQAANMDRINGWAAVASALGDIQAGQAPKLFIHRRCARLIECLPALQHDPNRPEDVDKWDCDDDGNGGDDPADALRYLVATKNRTVIRVRLRGG
jgi:phage terminase large subunit